MNCWWRQLGYMKKRSGSKSYWIASAAVAVVDRNRLPDQKGTVSERLIRRDQVHDITDRPQAIRDTRRHRWREPLKALVLLRHYPPPTNVFSAYSRSIRSSIHSRSAVVPACAEGSIFVPSALPSVILTLASCSRLPMHLDQSTVLLVIARG